MIKPLLRTLLRTRPGRFLFSRMQAACAVDNPAPVDASVIDVAADPGRALFDMVYQADLADRERHDFNDLRRAERLARDKSRPLTINWFVPEPTGGGSGGHMNIFQLARHLENAGHHNRLYAIPNCFLPNDGAMRDLIARHYCDPGTVETITDSRVLQDSDICVATGWDTAYRLYLMDNTRFKVYLVQDFEPAFYGIGSHYLFAENTYRMNFFGIFGSPWLATLMGDRYEFRGIPFRYGYDPVRYRRLPGVEREQDLVAAYIRPRTARRGLELMLGALAVLKGRRPQTRIILFGAAEKLRNLSFDCEQAGIMDEEGLCRLYNRAAVVLLTSLTNYSIIPVEAMACGALVVDVRMPSIQSVFTDGEHLALANADPLAMARTAARMLDATAERDRITSQAEVFIRDMRWEIVRNKIVEQLLAAYWG